MPVSNLHAAWGAWCRLVSDQSVDADGSRGYLVIHDRLTRFNPDHSATPEHTKVVLDVLYRGVPLLLAALGWDEPKAGSRGARTEQTDRARGDQWRLVMAYGGFETVAKGLLGFPEKSRLEPGDFAALVGACRLPRFDPIPSPRAREAVRERWFQPELIQTPRHPLLAFLGVHNGDAEVIDAWLVRGQPIETWEAALRTAQALRNVTAHGALSASKTREWKLRPAFERLTLDLADVTAAALRTLLTFEPAETSAVAVS